jgi:hypothetical protein
MSELIIVEILASLGIVSLIFYVVFSELRKRHRHNKALEQKNEIIRVEKELDRTDAIARGLHLVFNKKRSIVK